MAIKHRAYTFTSKIFHEYLQHTILHNNGKIDLTSLKSIVDKNLKDYSQMSKQVLDDLRFSYEWIETTSESENPQPTYLYLIILSAWLKPTLSLSGQLPMSWKVLELLLPHLGWHINDMNILLRGKPLHTLVESSHISSFISKFSCIDQFGGWIDLDTIKYLHSILNASKVSLLELKEICLPISNFAQLLGRDSQEIISVAFIDAENMLSRAIEENSDLFVVLD